MYKEFIIVTEGEFDAKVLNILLKHKKLTSKYNIQSANGYSSALSKVKSLLTTTMDNKIVLLLDSDTVDEIEIKKKEDFVNSYINSGFYKERFKVFWAIPEFEIVFLNNRVFLKKLMEKRISNDLFELGKSSPKRMLENVSKKRREDFIHLIQGKDILDEFFKVGLIKEISDYLSN